MTLQAVQPHPIGSGHIVLPRVSWEYYEHTLEQIGEGTTRVAFLDGSIEIMSPLPKHEKASQAIAELLRMLTAVRDIPLASYGSTTFRREDRLAGLEPDKCFYLQNEPRVRNMEVFDPKIHPAPDLAVEVDITNSSIPRETIYARLGVPELWRFEGQALTVRLLEGDAYLPSPVSRALPFLPIAQFSTFVLRMLREPQTTVIREFQDWAQKLP